MPFAVNRFARFFQGAVKNPFLLSRVAGGRVFHDFQRFYSPVPFDPKKRLIDYQLHLYTIDDATNQKSNHLNVRVRSTDVEKVICSYLRVVEEPDRRFVNNFISSINFHWFEVVDNNFKTFGIAIIGDQILDPKNVKPITKITGNFTEMEVSVQGITECFRRILTIEDIKRELGQDPVLDAFANAETFITFRECSIPLLTSREFKKLK